MTRRPIAILLLLALFCACGQRGASKLGAASRDGLPDTLSKAAREAQLKASDDSLSPNQLDSIAEARRDSAATLLDTAGEGGQTDATTGAPPAPANDPLSTNRASHPIHLQKGIDLQLSLPKGYDIAVAAEGLRRLRFLAKSPDGRLFATDMHDVSDNKLGRVYIFEDWDPARHQFKNVRVYLDSLHNPNQVAFYEDKGEQYIYVSETGRLARYPYHAGDQKPSAPAQPIASWPDYGLSYKYGGWHLTRSLDFHNGKLYVSVGSSCNACIEKEGVRATIQEMDPDGHNQKTYASGLRNSVGIKWVGDKLWATGMGRDLLGRDRPEDLFQVVERGGYYGWPYYFQYQGKVYPDTAMQDLARSAHIPVPPPPAPAYCGFKAHSAPLGLAWFKGFSDPILDNSFLVALHGSTTVSRLRGNSIVKITGPDQYVPVVDGFLAGRTDQDRKGRPCDVIMNDARSFFFTDDYNGVLYYVWKP